MIEWTAEDVHVLQWIEKHGVTLRVEGDRLLASPPEAVTEAIAAEIRKRKEKYLVLVPLRAAWYRTKFDEPFVSRYVPYGKRG